MDGKLEFDRRKKYYDILGAPLIVMLSFEGKIVLPIIIYYIGVLGFKWLFIIGWILWGLLFIATVYLYGYLGKYVGKDKEFASMEERILYIRKVSKQYILSFGGRQLADIYENLDQEELGELILKLADDYIEFKYEDDLLTNHPNYQKLCNIEKYYALNYLEYDNNFFWKIKFKNMNKELIKALREIQIFELGKFKEQKIIDVGLDVFISNDPAEMKTLLADYKMNEEQTDELMKFLIENLSKIDKEKYQLLLAREGYVNLSDEMKINVICSFMPSLILGDIYREYFRTIKYKNPVLGQEINKRIMTLNYLLEEELIELGLDGIFK